MPSRSLGHRAPLLWLILPFITGLVFGRITAADQPVGFLVAALPCGILAVSVARRPGFLWAAAISLGLMLAGAASYALHRSRLPVWDALPVREARLTLRVERTFVQSDPRRISGIAAVVDAEPHLRDLRGQRVYFSVTLRDGEAPPLRSARIEAVGVLVVIPYAPTPASFDGFLASAGVNFRFTRARLLAEVRPAFAYYRTCAAIAAHFNTVLGQGIVEKRPALAGLLRAMMLGDTHELSEEQHTLFMQSGTMHLFAISGLNIGVIATALQALLLLLRLPEWPRFLVGAVLLWLFVDITGASASAVRAFVMAVFLQASWLLRQPGNVLAALALSAFAVLLIAPLQVFSGSFLMSYGIVAALLVLGLPLAERWLARFTLWRSLPKPAWRFWQHLVDFGWRTTISAVAIGLATSLVSLLTGVQFFELLTPGALPANLILIPAAVIVTLGGFASLLCGLIGLSGGAVLCNHAAALVLLFIEALVRGSVRLPGAFVSARYAAEWLGPAALAFLLSSLLAGYAWGWRLRRGGWWPPFAWVALVVIFGMTFTP